MNFNKKALPIAVSLCYALASQNASAYDIPTGTDDINASLISNITFGTGIRAKSPMCALSGDPNATGCGPSANVDQWGAGSAGNLNYHKGDAFTTYLSATSELLVILPSSGWKFMARGTGMHDFTADHTQRTSLSKEAKDQVVDNWQLLDLWAQKHVDVFGNQGRVRLGNQVINWGESYYAAGGINATNSVDVQKLLVPGTQLKQALLPAPMISYATELPGGFSTEAYYQFRWNSNRFAPVGTYWSFSNVFGKGLWPFTVNTLNANVNGVDAGTIAGPHSKDPGVIENVNAGLLNGAYEGAPYNSIGFPVFYRNPDKKTTQYGIKLNYRPSSFDANFAFYYLNYTDKSPVLSTLPSGTSEWSYLENRKLIGVSTSFPVGDWALGAELSYRPKEAVSLSGCYRAGTVPDFNTNAVYGINCAQWVDNKKYQFDINGSVNLTQTGFPLLSTIGADQAAFTTEFTWMYFPGLSSRNITRTFDGVSVTQHPSPGYATWLNENSGLGYPISQRKGTSSSGGLIVDFNWTYDGTLIHGWAVTPGITMNASLFGYTPTLSSSYLKGAKSVNAYIYFNQNPAVWQAGINYTAFLGDSNVQPYADRNFLGLFVTRNF